MPPMDELEWREFFDFSGGLWERNNDKDCAPNGLLECTDCFPQPWGGLKAFAEFQPIVSPWTSGDRPSGPTNALGIWRTQGTSTLYTIAVDGDNVRVFALAAGFLFDEGSLSGSDPLYVWDGIRVFSGVGLRIQTGIRWEGYRTAASGATPTFNLPLSDTNAGIWQASGTTASRLFNLGPTFQNYGLWTYQARLLTIQIDPQAAARYNTISYTDAGSSAAPSTANFLQPLGENGGDLRFVSPFAPSDLTFMKRGRAFGSVQGAITAPTVREFEQKHVNARGFPTPSSIGLVVVVENEGAYAWDGQSFQHVSPSILGDPMGGTAWDATDPNLSAYDLPGLPITTPVSGHVSGQLGAYEHWVFFNNGYMMDSRTGAWFKQSSAPGARYWASDHEYRRVYVACRTAFEFLGSSLVPSPNPFYWSRMGEAQWTPMHTYSFTIPLIEAPGQRVNLRELEYEVYAYNDNSTITVEVTSPDGSLDELGPYDLAQEASSVRVLVPGHPAEWYKVRTILKSNRSGEEAPLMSKMRVGTQASTRNAVNR